MPKISHVSRLTSHVSRLTSHVSRLTSHVSRLTSHVSRLNHLSRLQFQVLVQCINRYMLGWGENRENAVFLQLFYNKLFFKSEFFGDGFSINRFNIACTCPG